MIGIGETEALVSLFVAMVGIGAVQGRASIKAKRNEEDIHELTEAKDMICDRLARIETKIDILIEKTGD